MEGKIYEGQFHARPYMNSNFMLGRSFRDPDDFNTRLRAWLFVNRRLRIHGTTHQGCSTASRQKRPALSCRPPELRHAMVRDRVVGDDWLVSVDSDRYSVPRRLNRRW
jgi:hypothetical protein